MQKEAIAPSSPTAVRGPSVGTALLCIVTLALVIFGIRLAVAVHSPFFGGDAGFRLHAAGLRLPIVRMGNRMWLPWLQTHIWAFYRLHLPYYVFKLIPCFYFFISVLLLGIFTWSRSTKSYGELLFTLFLMFCFGYQFEVQGLSIQLYQEALDLGLFFLLLWCGAFELRPNSWLLLIAGAALLTREDFWIYLFTISLLNYKQILSNKGYRRSFLFLWSIPALWLLSTPLMYRRFVGRFPSFPTEWPLGINKEGNRALAHLSTSLSNLRASLVYSRVTYLVGGLIVVWIIGRVAGRTAERSAKPADTFESRFPPFSFLSLGIILTLVILFDPWEYTSGSGRFAIPIIAQGFVWAGLLFARTYSYPAPAKILSRSVLVAALVLGMNLNVRAWIPQPGNPEEKSVAEISGLVRAAGGNRKANVCVLIDDSWEALTRFAAPTLYATWSPTPNEDVASGACDAIIRPTDSRAIVPGLEYAKFGEYEFGAREEFPNRAYAVFQKASPTR